MSNTGVERASEELLYLQCFQCSLTCGVRPLLATHPKVGRGHKTSTQSCCFQYHIDQIARRRFATSASDTNRTQMLSWILVEGTGEICKRKSNVPYLYIWERKRGQCVILQRFAKCNSCSSPGCIIQETPPIGMISWYGDKQSTLLYLSRIVGQCVYLGSIVEGYFTTCIQCQRRLIQ